MMPRLHAVALSAVLLLPGVALAQAAAKDEAAPPAATELDPKTKAAIQREIEKAKDDIRNEVRAEIQGAQSAAEFMGAVAEGPKLEFLELDGYLRLRGQLLDNLDLGEVDTSGRPFFPTPLENASGKRGTLASANMRLRLEPTLNVSEHVRVRAQVDVFDNYVLGSSTSALFDGAGSPYPMPFYGSSRSALVGPQEDRPAIIPKRAWAEIQTPVGLLSFGRMPSQWALGVLSHAGQGLDDDFGDTVDRIQFALPPVSTPVGRLNFVPMIDFDSEGVLHLDPRFGAGVGQPFDAESGDDARTFALKIARLDTEDEIRRKLERNERSVNFGAYYNYRTQRNTYPEWTASGLEATSLTQLHRSAYAHVLDLWARWLSGRWRVEAEAVGVYGQLGNVPNPLTGSIEVPVSPTNPSAIPATPATLMRVLLRQWGGTLLTEYKAMPNKVTLGFELGIASGDDAPGFGNVPSRVTGAGTPANPWRLNYGVLEGPQFGRPGDHSIRNFRFNPGYQVDLVLWRRILGQVTDAWYGKPKVRWDILPGLAFDGALVYSQALSAPSTPSSRSADPAVPNSSLVSAGKKPLGVEADGKLTLTTGDGFVAWGEVGVFQPYGGGLGSSPSRGWVLDFGFAAKF